MRSLQLQLAPQHRVQSLRHRVTFTSYFSALHFYHQLHVPWGILLPKCEHTSSSS